MVLKALLRGLGFVTGLFAMAGCSGMPVATFVEPAQNTELACDPANASLRDSTDVGAALSVEVVDQPRWSPIPKQRGSDRIGHERDGPDFP